MAKHAGGAPIIIKKIKKGGHGHHGGAWKVAYADFVTAMMAFFMLLWLLNVTTDVQKRGIADYFEPTITSKSASGAGGVLGGLTVGSPGASSVSQSLPSFELSHNALRQPTEGDDGDDGGTAGQDKEQSDTAGAPVANDDTNNGSNANKKVSDEELQKQLAAKEEKQFQDAKSALEQAVKQVPDLQGLAQNLKIDETPEGLRIQLVDQDKSAMFPTGSAEPGDTAKKLTSLVAQVIAKLPNKVSITGHTDSTQYAANAKYTNWELSTDRANASRREFIAQGFAPTRLQRVVGMADGDPIDKANPSDPQNRRISIVLLRENNAPMPAQPVAPKKPGG